MPYAKLIQNAMKTKKITAKELSNKCDINETYISHILNGKKIPKEDKSIKIANALDIDERELILEGYLDKKDTPPEILELLNSFCSLGYEVAQKMFTKSTEMFSNAGVNLSINDFKNIAKGEPMARTILELISSMKISIESINDISNNFKIEELNPKTGKMVSSLYFKDPVRSRSL